MEELLILASQQNRYLKLVYNICVSSNAVIIIRMTFIVSVLHIISGLKYSMIEKLVGHNIL